MSCSLTESAKGGDTTGSVPCTKDESKGKSTGGTKVAGIEMLRALKLKANPSNRTVGFLYVKFLIPMTALMAGWNPT
jgi:hypothetical protein